MLLIKKKLDVYLGIYIIDLLLSLFFVISIICGISTSAD